MEDDLSEDDDSFSVSDEESYIDDDILDDSFGEHWFCRFCVSFSSSDFGVATASAIILGCAIFLFIYHQTIPYPRSFLLRKENTTS